MTAVIAIDPVVARFRAALDDMYGDRIARVILFGSRARGDAHAESDYDVAVFLKAMEDRWAEVFRLSDLGVKFTDESRVFFDAKPFLDGELADRSPLMHEIRREGIDL